MTGDDVHETDRLRNKWFSWRIMGIDGQPVRATTSRDKIVVEQGQLTRQRWRRNDLKQRYG